MKVRLKAKRRRRQPTAFRKEMKCFFVNILSSVIASVIAAAVLKLLGW